MNMLVLMALSRVRRRRSHRTNSGNTAELSPEFAVPFALLFVAFICFVIAFNVKNKLLKILLIIGSVILALCGIVFIVKNIVN